MLLYCRAEKMYSQTLLLASLRMVPHRKQIVASQKGAMKDVRMCARCLCRIIKDMQYMSTPNYGILGRGPPCKVSVSDHRRREFA